MQTVVGVRFKKAGKIFYFSPGRLDIQAGDLVIVRTVHGIECATAVTGLKEVPDSEIKEPLQAVQRKVTDNDLQRLDANKAQEKEAFDICLEKIEEHNLPMKLVNVECAFDLSKIVFYFTADGRVDFRELVRDLASVFRTRIELRQIGVRDQAKLLGGIGCCGRPLCCASFLGDFAPVSIRMAKGQRISLNPTKISGICGRLMCCLRFEDNVDCCDCCGSGSAKTKAVPPAQGARVVTDSGDGKVISVNAQRHSCTILLDNHKTIVAAWDDVAEIDEGESVDFLTTNNTEYDLAVIDNDDIIAEPFAETTYQEKEHKMPKKSVRNNRQNNGERKQETSYSHRRTSRDHRNKQNRGRKYDRRNKQDNSDE